MTIRRNLTAAVAAILILSLIGCSTSPIEVLNLAVGALEIALPLIGPAAGLDSATTTAVESYLGATSQAITRASDILASPGLSPGQKTAAIVAAFAGIAAPVVPAKYEALAAAVQQVAQYVAKFLASLPAPAAASAKMAVAPRPLPADQLEKLRSIKARAIAVGMHFRR